MHYLMSVPERLPPQTRKELKEVGRTKGWSWSWRTLRGGTGRTSIVQSGLHKAREMPTEQFKQGVGRSNGAGNRTAGDYLLQVVQVPAADS